MQYLRFSGLGQLITIISEAAGSASEGSSIFQPSWSFLWRIGTNFNSASVGVSLVSNSTKLSPCCLLMIFFSVSVRFIYSLLDLLGRLWPSSNVATRQGLRPPRLVRTDCTLPVRLRSQSSMYRVAHSQRTSRRRADTGARSSLRRTHVAAETIWACASLNPSSLSGEGRNTPVPSVQGEEA